MFNKIAAFIFATVILVSATASCLVPSNAASGLYRAVTGEYFGLGQCEDKGYYRKELSLGVQNALLRARQMQELAWSPLEDMYMYANSETTGKLFREGYTYQGLPYGQPVHFGKYIGFNVTLDEFLAATQNEQSEFYTERGQNTWYYEAQAGDCKIRFGPYLATDCSSFVSYCWQLDARTTTSMMSEDPERFIVLGKSVDLLEPGFAINAPGNHVILIYDVVYDSDGKVASVTTIEQTPPMMEMRTFGLGGTAGTLDDLQEKLNGSYSVIRYRDIETVTYEPVDSVNVEGKTYVAGVEMPLSVVANDSAAEGVITLDEEQQTVTVSGWALHKQGIKSFSYSVDGGKEKTVKSSYNADYCAPNTLYYEFDGTGGKNCFSFDVKAEDVAGKELIVYGKAGNGDKVEVAKLSVKEAEIGDLGFETDFYFDTPWIYAEEDGVCRTKVKVTSEADLLVPFNGWAVCSDDILRFEMSVDGGMWQTVPTSFREDVYQMKSSGMFANCRNNNAFKGVIDLRHLGIHGDHDVAFRAVTANNETYTIAEWQFEYKNAFIIEIVALAFLAVLLVVAIIVTCSCVSKRKKAKLAVSESVTVTAEAAAEAESEAEAEGAVASEAEGEEGTEPAPENSENTEDGSAQ